MFVSCVDAALQDETPDKSCLKLPAGCWVQSFELHVSGAVYCAAYAEGRQVCRGILGAPGCPPSNPQCEDGNRQRPPFKRQELAWSFVLLSDGRGISSPGR